MQDKKIRAFFAIDLPENIRHEVISLIMLLKKANPNKNIIWVKPENLHITLKFLGNIAQSQYERFLPKIEAVISECKKFEIQFLEGFELSVLDEIQYCKDAGRNLKYLVDSDRKLWITSSSEVLLGKKILSYLVGRISIIKLYPFSYNEFLKSKGINAEEELEEETLRVNFVAFTRAKNKLYIITEKPNEYMNDFAEIKEIEVDMYVDWAYNKRNMYKVSKEPNGLSLLVRKAVVWEDDGSYIEADSIEAALEIYFREDVVK